MDKIKKHFLYLILIIVIILFFYSHHLNLDLYHNTKYFPDGGISDLQKHFAPNIFMILDGNLFWNDYSFGGEPFFGIPNKFAFYPFLWIFLIFDNVAWIANLSVLFHLILAGISMYFLCFEVFKEREESLVGALIFVLGGFMFSMDYLNYLDFLFAYALLPLIFLFFYKIRENKKFILLVSLFLAFQYYAGAVEIFLLSATLLLFFSFYFVWKYDRKYFYYSFLIFFVCFGLIAPKLFMDLEFVSKSSRASEGLEHEFPGNWFKSPAHLFSRLTNIPSGFEPVDADSYIGLIGLILVLFSLGMFKNDFVKFNWILIIVSFLLTLATPFYSLVHMLPLYSKISYINRFMLFFAFSSCFLAGYGYRFIKQKLASKNLFLLIVILSFSSFYLTGYATRDYEDFNSKLDDVPILEFIKNDNDTFRVFYVDVLNREGGFIDYSFNHYLLMNKIENVNGYDGNIVVQNYVDFFKTLDENQLKKLGYLNVKYLISSKELNWPLINKFDVCSSCYPLDVNGPYLYKNPYFKERAYVVLDNGDVLDVKITSSGLKRVYSFDYVEKGILVLSENFWNYSSWTGEDMFRVNGINTGIRVDGKDSVELRYVPIKMIIGVVVMILILNILFYFRKRLFLE